MTTRRIRKKSRRGGSKKWEYKKSRRRGVKKTIYRISGGIKNNETDLTKISMEEFFDYIILSDEEFLRKYRRNKNKDILKVVEIIDESVFELWRSNTPDLLEIFEMIPKKPLDQFSQDELYKLNQKITQSELYINIDRKFKSNIKSVYEKSEKNKDQSSVNRSTLQDPTASSEIRSSETQSQIVKKQTEKNKYKSLQITPQGWQSTTNPTRGGAVLEALGALGCLAAIFYYPCYYHTHDKTEKHDTMWDKYNSLNIKGKMACGSTLLFGGGFILVGTYGAVSAAAPFATVFTLIVKVVGSTLGSFGSLASGTHSETNAAINPPGPAWTFGLDSLMNTNKKHIHFKFMVGDIVSLYYTDKNLDKLARITSINNPAVDVATVDTDAVSSISAATPTATSNEKKGLKFTIQFANKVIENLEDMDLVFKHRYSKGYSFYEDETYNATKYTITDVNETNIPKSITVTYNKDGGIPKVINFGSYEDEN